MRAIQRRATPPQTVYTPTCDAPTFRGRFNLTNSEVRIADFIMAGFTTLSIACLMGLRSEQDVKNRVVEIYNKTRCGNRAELVAVGILGWERVAALRKLLCGEVN
jgi:DNA-binding NarL/FixJ family response regulator